MKNSRVKKIHRRLPPPCPDFEPIPMGLVSGVSQSETPENQNRSGGFDSRKG
jgi:hypothetical protein